jgi:hypothetical protein
MVDEVGFKGDLTKLKKIFISSGCIESDNAQELVRALKKAGFQVDHSPKDGSDPRFEYWYGRDLDLTLLNTDVFIAFVDESWEGSTWMAHEAEQALNFYHSGEIKEYYYFCPKEMDYIALGMRRYLINKLPTNISDLVRQLNQET